MPEAARTLPGYHPLLLTTQRLYPRWQELLWNVRVPERKGLIVVLPQGSPRARAALLAIARRYQARGGSVRIVEEGSGVERYYEMRDRLAGGRR
ncbi:MAG: hypothetical protein GXY76_07830 [Chloroflexi bacterium]|nr:hypothetical protein [Chloroflexota bacterium]